MVQKFGKPSKKYNFCNFFALGFWVEGEKLEKPSWIVKKQDRFQNIFDLDHDGFLKNLELENWVFRDEQAELGAEILDHCDSNGDRKLNQKEVEENISTFSTQHEWAELWDTQSLEESLE